MINISKLKPGMTVYDVHSHRAGNTTCKTWGEWQVLIKEVGENFVVASWNGNPAEKYFGTKFNWRLNKTVFVKSPSGMTKRPATRDELKAMKRDTSNQLLPAREVFKLTNLLNEIWLLSHPDCRPSAKPEHQCPKESTPDRDQSDS